jgi:hypothetical protein
MFACRAAALTYHPNQLSAMGLLRWIQSRLATTHRPAAALPHEQTWSNWEGYGYLGAVGESQYQPALQQIARGGRICEATLVPEPDNPFDVNAVAVKVNGHVVGYLPRSHARKYQRRLLALTEPFRCSAKLIGGVEDKPSFGILLDTRVIEHMPTPKSPRKKHAIDPNETPF